MKCFVVVGMPRTGSTLLSTGLAQHQHARCFGELFHPVENERAHAHALNIDGRRVSFNPLKDDAVEFLNEYVFSDRNADVTTVGFKLFGEYVKGPGSEGLFRQLREKFPQLHVIHIFRRNYLEVLLSRETAAATKQWVVFASGNEEIKGGGPITIDPVVAQRFFENMQRMDHFYESYFGGDRYFKAGYEELDNDFQGTMTRAYAFLGLPPQEVKPQTIKQRTKSLRERIVNYDALALTFKDTGFADFFFESGSTDRTEPAAPFQAGVMHPALGPRILDGGLRTLIDEANEIARTEADLNVALAGIPLDLFALMQLYRGRLPEPLRGRIPPLPTPSEQVTWAGDSGLPLMLRTSDYTKLMVNRYLRSRTKRLSEVYFLDYGCGWGRIMRFMAALIPTSHIFGVDPMQASLDICGPSVIVRPTP
jgi:LPS sulfotransferase NodH